MCPDTHDTMTPTMVAPLTDWMQLVTVPPVGRPHNNLRVAKCKPCEAIVVQDEKNEIITTNVWLLQVGNFTDRSILLKLRLQTPIPLRIHTLSYCMV